MKPNFLLAIAGFGFGMVLSSMLSVSVNPVKANSLQIHDLFTGSNFWLDQPQEVDCASDDEECDETIACCPGLECVMFVCLAFSEIRSSNIISFDISSMLSSISIFSAPIETAIAEVNNKVFTDINVWLDQPQDIECRQHDETCDINNQCCKDLVCNSNAGTCWPDCHSSDSVSSDILTFGISTVLRASLDPNKAMSLKIKNLWMSVKYRTGGKACSHDFPCCRGYVCQETCLVFDDDSNSDIASSGISTSTVLSSIPSVPINPDENTNLKVSILAFKPQDGKQPCRKDGQACNVLDRCCKGLTCDEESWTCYSATTPEDSSDIVSSDMSTVLSAPINLARATKPKASSILAFQPQDGGGNCRYYGEACEIGGEPEKRCCKGFVCDSDTKTCWVLDDDSADAVVP